MKLKDPYLQYAKKLGLVPHKATEFKSKEERQKFKKEMLGLHYGVRPTKSFWASVLMAKENKTL